VVIGHFLPCPVREFDCFFRVFQLDLRDYEALVVAMKNIDFPGAAGMID
jgi:hypothetical protein